MSLLGAGSGAGTTDEIPVVSTFGESDQISERESSKARAKKPAKPVRKEVSGWLTSLAPWCYHRPPREGCSPPPASPTHYRIDANEGRLRASPPRNGAHPGARLGRPTQAIQFAP